MEIIRYPQYSPIKTEHSCITIGNFDGVHLGHQSLIKKVVDKAKLINGKAIVVTMHPLPIQFFSGKQSVALITSFKQKVRLMASLGVDVLCILNFNKNLASMPAAQFFQNIIVKGLQAEYLLVGDDFKFGNNRSGDAAFLSEQCEQSGIEFEQQTSVLLEEQRISSSLVRTALEASEFNQVQKYLGRHYVVCGRVSHGKKLGRTLGFPTLNIHFKNGANALHGIYVVAVKIKGLWHDAVASVGLNPTVNDDDKRLEVHVLDFSDNVYSEWVEVLFYKKLRNEVKFDGLSALQSAIATDVEAARQYFEEHRGDLV